MNVKTNIFSFLHWKTHLRKNIQNISRKANSHKVFTHNRVENPLNINKIMAILIAIVHCSRLPSVF